MIPKNFFSLFSVCNKAFMICLREYSFTEFAKTGLISYFVFPAERFTHVRDSFLPRYSFCVKWRTVVFNSYAPVFRDVSFLQKTKLGTLTPDLFKLFCLENGMRQFFIFSLFFLIDSLEYLDIVLSEINDMTGTAISAPFSLTLKETTLSEQGV